MAYMSKLEKKGERETHRSRKVDSGHIMQSLIGHDKKLGLH